MAEALYFDSGTHRLFGWYHTPPAGNPGGFGVVLCKPFGYEAICAHRSIRAFAEAAADIGVPTLRFDYAGAGDSSDIDPQLDQLRTWVDDIAAAARELRRLSGLHRVYLLGFRLGGLLATLASEHCQGVEGLVLVAPVINGRRLVRELRTMRLAASMGKVPSKNAEFMEVSGFTLSAATIRALTEVSLAPPRIPISSKVLVIDGASMPLARTWTEDLSAAGISAEYRALPGMVEMLMTAPQFATVPAEMISTMCEWLVQRQPQKPSDRPGNESSRQASVDALMTVMNPTIPNSTRSGKIITERPAFIGQQKVLFGIVSEPEQGGETERAMIMVNAGADYHIGASGIYVSLARRWAQSGYVALRMDLAGLGDSGTSPGRPDNEVFPPGALDDIREAIGWIRTQYRSRDITLVGFCSGAYHVMRAAIEAVPINRVIMVNPETFFWNEGQSIYGVQTAELVRQPETYRNKLLSIQSWKRILNGQINFRYAFHVFTGRFSLSLVSAVRNVARQLRLPLPNDLGRQLEGAGARGVRLVFVFSRGEPGFDLLRLQAGVSLERLAKHCQIHIVDDADHVFSKHDSRATLERILSGELDFAQHRP